jgi:MFS superfamily sulfate permease-like transporter
LPDALLAPVEVLVMWKFFKWGAKNHPGNPIYLLAFVGVWLAAMKNADIKSGIIAGIVATCILVCAYVLTSISVGKANRGLVDDYYT